MADDANEPLPGLTLLFAQRLAQVGEHEQLVRETALPERAAPDFPPADAAGKGGVDHARRLTGQAILQADLVRPTAEQALGALAEEPGAGPVDELQLLVLVEGEDGDVDFRHDFSQQRGRLERVEALMPQRFDQRVDLDQDFAERIAAARAPGANGEVSFTERGEQIGERLQGQDDAFAQREREAEAEGDDDDGERPLDLWACSRRSRGKSAR